LQRAAPVASAADQLLSSIDLGFDNAPSVKVLDKKEPDLKPDLAERRKQANEGAATPELKTVVNVISELSGDLRERISNIERRFKLLGQLSNKLRHSVSTLQDKAAQIRPASSAEDDPIYSGSSERGSRVGPLDQLQDAFFALKQQGVRLYLAILDNHSSKQLAVETEQLNLLVDRVEATVSKMRGSLALALDQAAASEKLAPEVSLEAIELMSMDAKQVIRDLDVWEEEFDGLGQEFSDLKRQAKT
jgi:methyl-accepting chemotaxis protein